MDRETEEYELLRIIVEFVDVALNIAKVQPLNRYD